MFSECWLEGDQDPAEQNCLCGVELTDSVPREQKGFFIKDHFGDQEKSFYGAVGSHPEECCGPGCRLPGEASRDAQGQRIP